MQRFAFLLLVLLTVGCGAPASNRDPLLKGSALPQPSSIAALVPASTPVNSVPFTMTVTGSNFGTDAIVIWNGTPLQTTFVSSQALMASLTSTDLQYAGLIPVYVRSGGLNSNTVQFNLQQ
jgi:hypothetical protein